jgi:hypothetical protein
VKLDKLAKQLRRDLAANPKKAAALGLMALVALYFWAPLVWRWFSPEGGKKSGAAATALILTDDPEEPAAAAKRRGGKFRWDKVRQLIADDKRMASAAYDAAWTDPFAGQAAPPAAAAAGTVPAAANGGQQAIAAADVEPQQAGLTLSGVMIGSKRTATINGETWLEGSRILASGEEGQPDAVEFRLVRITSRGVELERRGKRYILLCPRPELAKGDQIGQAGATKD